MPYRPGDAYSVTFWLSSAGGGVVNFDSATSQTIYVMHTTQSGVSALDTTFASGLSVNNINSTTGFYQISGTGVPMTYNGGDTFDVSVVGIVSSTTVASRVDHQVVDRLSYIKKNTAFTFPFYMPLSSDHVSPGSGLSVTAKVVLDGSNITNTVGSVTETNSGYYKLSGAAADSNCTFGIFQFSAPGCDTQRFPFVTEP